MRIPKKQKEIHLPAGTGRIVRRFAWLPVTISDFSVWLEHYEVMQVLESREYVVDLEGQKIRFNSFKWIELTKRLIK